jgi:hypothetical protein
MGEVIQFTKKPVRRRKKASPVTPVAEEIMSMVDKMDVFIGIGRKKRKGKYEYYIFAQDMSHRNRLDLSEMLLHLITESMIHDADKRD